MLVKIFLSVLNLDPSSFAVAISRTYAECRCQWVRKQFSYVPMNSLGSFGQDEMRIHHERSAKESQRQSQLSSPIEQPHKSGDNSWLSRLSTCECMPRMRDDHCLSHAWPRISIPPKNTFPPGKKHMPGDLGV